MTTDNTRLGALRLIMKLMVGFAIAVVVWMMLGSLPQRQQEARTVSVSRYDVSDMVPGEHRLVEWQKKPVSIVYRKPEWESALKNAEPSLYRDFGSEHSTQPDNAANSLRSPVDSFFVTLSLGTGAGCTLNFHAPANDIYKAIDSNTASGSLEIYGGFTDTCDNAEFDLAGRVYENQSAKRNTVIPLWRLIDGFIEVTE